MPDSYEWTPLSYPATYEEKQSLIVTKIQQLREQNRATEIAAGKLTKDEIEAEVFVSTSFELAFDSH